MRMAAAESAPQWKVPQWATRTIDLLRLTPKSSGDLRTAQAEGADTTADAERADVGYTSPKLCS